MSKRKALLILNGNLDLSRESIKSFIKKKDIIKIIAVDGGANNAKRLELLPDIIIGDLDSISEKSLNYYREEKVKIIKHPVEKDQTDSEIAVDYCLEKNFEELYITAALGGRIDQQIANLNLLEYIYELGLKAQIISKNIEISLLDNSKVYRNKKGYRLSLIPQTKTVEKLTITGCKYNLDSKNINRSQTRGVSNLIQSEKAEIKLEKGLLFSILEKIE